MGGGTRPRWTSLEDLWGPEPASAPVRSPLSGSESEEAQPEPVVVDPWTFSGVPGPHESPVQVAEAAPPIDRVETESAPPVRGGRVGSNGAVQAPEAGNGQAGADRSDLAKLARGGALNFAGAVASGVFGFLLVIVVSKGMNPAQAGVFFEAIALFSIVANISELGADDGMVRFVARYRAMGRVRDLRSMLWIGVVPVAIWGCLLGAAMFLLASPLSHLFIHGHEAQEQALIPYIRVLAVFVPLAAVLQTLFSASRGFGTMLPSVALDNFGRSGSRPFLALAVIAAGLGSTALAVSWAIPTLIALVVMVFWVRRLLRRTEHKARELRQTGTLAIPEQAGRGQVAGEFWRFAAPRGAGALFGITVYWLDTLLVGAIRSTKDAAVYTLASRYMFVGFFALSAIQLVIGPMISGLLTQGSHQRAKDVYQTATQWLVAASWPVYVTLCVFAPLLLRIFRPEYVRGQDAMFTLSVAMLVSIASGPVMVVLLMSGKSLWTLLNSMISLALNITLNLLLIPKFGMEGAAIAWLVSIVFSNVAGIIEVRYLLKLTPFGRTFPLVAGASLLCFGVLGVAVRQWFGMSALSFIGFGVVATGLYAAILWRFRDRLHLDMLLEGVRLRRDRTVARAGAGNGL